MYCRVELTQTEYQLVVQALARYREELQAQVAQAKEYECAEALSVTAAEMTRLIVVRFAGGVGG